MKWLQLAFLLALAAISAADQLPQVSIDRQDVPYDAIRYFDDSHSIVALRDHQLLVLLDDGNSFKQVEELKDLLIMTLQMDKFTKQRAFAFDLKGKLLFLKDEGKLWKKITFLTKGDQFNIGRRSRPDIRFNAANSDLLLAQVPVCNLEGCYNKYFYSDSGGDKWLPLIAHAELCAFLQSLEHFTGGTDRSVICGVNARDQRGHVTGASVLRSDDWFKLRQEMPHPKIEHGRVRDVRVKLLFLVVTVVNDRYSNDADNHHLEMLILTTGETLEELNFSSSVARGRVLFLPLTPQLLHVMVTLYAKLEFGTFPLLTVFASDTSGLRFRSVMKNVVLLDVLKVQTIDGVWFVNVAQKNEVDDEPYFGRPKSRTQYTIDEGRTWRLLNINPDTEEGKKCNADVQCFLNIMPPGVTSGDGKYETGATPGILMAVGNTGAVLKANDIRELKTWVLRDGGATWSKAVDEPCAFSFGDHGNVIIAIPWEVKEYYYYSVDQGRLWKQEKYPDNAKVAAGKVTTTVDGLALRFVMESQTDQFITYDFSNVFDGKTCGDGDMEEVYARVDEGEPTCLYGTKQKFKRRKADAKCFINKLWEDLFADDEQCECSELDFECAAGFAILAKDISGHTCVADPEQLKQMCQGQEGKKLRIPDKRKMVGDECRFSGKKELDYVLIKEIDCSQYTGGAPLGGIKQFSNEMLGAIKKYFYVREGHPDDDNPNEFGGENVIVHLTNGEVYASEDGGETFAKVETSDHILSIRKGAAPGVVVLVGLKKFYFSDDGGNSFKPRDMPLEPLGRVGKLEFDEKDSSKLMWFGCKTGPVCEFPDVWISDNSGELFKPLIQNAYRCLFVHLGNTTDEKILCTARKENDRIDLILTTNRFKDTNVLFEHVIDYALLGEFLVVAVYNAKGDGSDFKVLMDAVTFAQALFPLDRTTRLGTVLDSQSKALFLFQLVDDDLGVILKLNSNGTSYVTALTDVSRDSSGYVDYDRIDLLEGTLIANQVVDRNPKKVRTVISHNDGGEWAFLTPPKVDVNGKSYKCSGGNCHLHLEGYTNRTDMRDTYGLTLATGMLLGSGNVGEYLDPFDPEFGTFMLVDGGVTWKEVAKGTMHWEFGDHGSVVVLVDKYRPTQELQFSVDNGDSWNRYQFLDTPVLVDDLATSQRDTLLKFVLFTYGLQSRTAEVVAIDFQGLFDHQCQVNFDHPDSDDYEYWTPPYFGDGCIFGHRALYLRKVKGRMCFVGEAPLLEGYKVLTNCLCTRQDYECDYNYVRDPADNTCKLVPGQSPKDRKEQLCSIEGEFQYFKPTGYRKLPLLTCVGGTKFDQTKPEPCPGKEHEFRQHYGYSVLGFKVFFVFGVPALIFLFTTWFVYDRGIRRNGGFSQLGQIRLEDEIHLIEENNTDKAVNAIVKAGIYAVAGVYAAVRTIYRVDRALIERVVSVFRGRSQGTFVLVPEEDELFGDFHDEDAREYDEFEIPDDDEGDVDERLFGIDDGEEDINNETTR